MGLKKVKNSRLLKSCLFIVSYILILSPIIMAFLHLPDQNELRLTTSYHTIFALTLFWNIGLLALIFIFFFVISFVLKTYQLKTKKNVKNTLRESLMSQQSRQQSQRLSEKQPDIIDTDTAIEDVPLIQNPDTRRFKLCNFLTSLFFYLFWVCIGLVYLVFYIFGYMGRGLSHDILAVFIMVVIVVIPTLVWKNSTKVSQFRLIKKELIFTVCLLFFWLGVSVFTVVTLKGACLCYYNDNYGFSVGNNMGPFLSTEWTRTNAIQKICKDNQICNIYATVPLNTSTQVFINLHTGMGLENLTVRLNNSKLDKPYEKNITSYFNLTNVEEIGKRYVHTAYFKNLQPNTTYEVTVFKQPQQNQIYGSVLATRNYKTTPDQDTQQLRMAVGGDVSMTHQGIMITQNLVNYNPDIIIIGGDNTYDDGMRTCYYSWDNFYNLFDELNVKLNRLVPLVMSIGNHDVGFDSMATTEISREDDEIPLYFAYNPQHLDSKNKIPAPADRSGIHTHIIGPTVHLHLDSGYLTPFQSQSSLIQLVGQQYKGYFLFANYHNPIYPSCTNYNEGSNDMWAIQNGTEYWVPYFDQYNYTACFEHHTHHKKLTYKLKNNTVSTDGTGTRYVGDGSWGVVEGSCPQNKISPKEKFQFYDSEEPNHIWLVTLKKTTQSSYTINYTAIDINGESKGLTKIDILTKL